ncbi:MAG: cyclic nucleotide-binding domain-containing protein [Cyanobacteria bacterium SID2]|nr:cyclic nucleotide-binding domain-containing protein [Cyanobacteria bacterium SID2]
MLDPARTVSIFQKHAQPQKFSTGEVIFEEGQPGDVMYGIIEGAVDLKVNDKVAETIKQGDVFGEGALVHFEGTRASTAVAKTDCTLAILDRERFLFVIENTPMFALEVMHSMSKRLRHFKHPQE